MSVHRFLSQRHKNRDASKRHSIAGIIAGDHGPGVDPRSAEDFYGLFIDNGKPSSAEESKIKTIRHKIVAAKSVLLKDCHILWALRCNFSNGNGEAAQDLLMAFSDAAEGIIISYNPGTRLLGAVNRQAVTCYLDSTLFSMFSRLDSFEAMLYNSFEDLPRNRLGFLLRVWVNLLRAGKLITTDITLHIQETLAECGWKEAAKIHQQDASEAFSFITEKLNLPLLTLKMDMFHAGKGDADDHRFINERLLEVAIPSNENGDRKDIKLEDCLEEYFNNRIEVRRFLERRSTMGSTRSLGSISKEAGIHIETLELDGDASPLTPLSPTPSNFSALRPSISARTPSIIQERFIPAKGETSVDATTTKSSTGRLRKGSIRKEVLMPAWQFFSLIPWYTDNAPSNDAQVAAHFSSKRPVLGLCLKRYSMAPNGRPVRLNTYIDVPVEIGLPHFIHDDHMDENAPLYGNFKLTLQSVVCHRGTSVDSGHYIALVRGTPLPGSESDTAHWMRFDDLASERITLIDIHKALQEETPYLLFYQIMPVDGDPGNLTAGESPPPYAVSEGGFNLSGSTMPHERRLSTVPSENPSGRTSLEIPPSEEYRGRIAAGSRRPSAISFREHLSSPNKDGSTSTGSGRSKSTSLSRSSTMLSRTLSNLASTKPKETPGGSHPHESEVIVQVTEARTNDSVPPQDSSSKELLAKGTKKDKEKSRTRLGRSRNRLRGEDPDRECLVM